MQKLANRGLQNTSSQLTDPSALPGIIEEWKIGGAVGSVNYIFLDNYGNSPLSVKLCNFSLSSV